MSIAILITNTITVSAITLSQSSILSVPTQIDGKQVLSEAIELRDECSGENGRPNWCTMDNAWRNDLLESDSDEVFCNDCTNEMIEHISKHHLYAC